MKVINLDKNHQSLSRLLRLAKSQPVVLTRKGKPLAALVDVQGDDLETLSLRTNAEFQDYLNQCRERHGREGGVRLEDIRVRYGLPSRVARPGDASHRRKGPVK